MYENFIYSSLFDSRIARYRNSTMKNKPGPTTTDSASSLREKRNNNIRRDFYGQYDRGLRVEVILMDLSDRYYLAEDTIERIVFQRGRYRALPLVVESQSVSLVLA